jgi:omega-amidase
MRIIGCQHDIEWEDAAANHERVEGLLRSRQLEGGSLVVLPEMFASGFSLAVEQIAEERGGVTERFLARLAKELGVFLMAGVVTRGGAGRGRNESVTFSPEGLEVARYCKMQPFAPGGESAVYEAGESALRLDWNGVWVAPYVCYDLRFPEIFRPMAVAGVELMAVIASWPEARIHHWVRLLRARAIENQCWVVGVNRVGRDPRFLYNGRSVIVDHHGELVAEAGNGEGLMEAFFDVEALREYRRDRPFLQDIRSEFVGGSGASGRSV